MAEHETPTQRYMITAFLSFLAGGVIASMPSYSSGVRHGTPQRVHERTVGSYRVLVAEDKNHRRTMYVSDGAIFRPLEQMVKDEEQRKVIREDTRKIPYHK